MDEHGRFFRDKRNAAVIKPTFGSRLRSFVANRFRQIRREVRNRFFVASERFYEELAGGGQTPAQFLAARRAVSRQYVEAVCGRERLLVELCPAECERLSLDAARILDHTFDLLGSGPYTPVDHGRAMRPSGYRPIDWYLDPVRGLRFPAGIPFKEWKLLEMRPGNADVKYPWELGRCQHLVTLAQAWRIQRRPQYVREIYDQIADFMEANPVGFGIQWTCTMDVAIRAANWAIAMALTLDDDTVSDEERIEAYGALFDHGRFIFENLENTYEVTSNHFLSNIVGLHLVSAEFLDLAQGKSWDDFCRSAVEREITVQVHPEGADYESSVPYHRLVTELFLASYRLAQFQRRPLSTVYADRLRAMVQFLVDVQRPDGLMPVIGDADDGRFHIFTDYGSWRRQDARHVYAPAALALGQAAWLGISPSSGRWEAAWWGFDPENLEVGGASLPDACRLFAEIGIAVARSSGTYLAVTNGRVGTKGFGNHKHNELLGFEYHVGGQAMLVDPGSYVYTADFSARNLFRSTAVHNTVMIDGIEQNETNPQWIFRLFESANPEHLIFAREGATVVYLGRHTGYRRTAAEATHERRFELNLATGALVVTDRITGRREADVHWHFHVAPGVAVKGGPSAIYLSFGGVVICMDMPAGLRAEIGDGAYSPSYGVAVPCRVINVSMRLPLDGRAYTFRFTPERVE